MVLGTDFDNTVAEYAHLFPMAAADIGLELPDDLSDKQRLRDHVRSLPGGEILWQKIQARVYGTHMSQARLMDGFAAVAGRCRDHGVPVYIISHKTQFAAQDDTVDLRACAMDWMKMHGFFEAKRLGLASDQVFFEDTREEKIERLRLLHCAYFVDDMVEVLRDECFPPETVGIWFSREPEPADGLRRASSWTDVERILFG